MEECKSVYAACLFEAIHWHRVAQRHAQAAPVYCL